MLGSMLRCESLSPRRRTRARHLAAYSFAILVVGGAIVDATVLRHEPKQQAANVEVQTADEPQAALPPLVVAKEGVVFAEDTAAHPPNRIAIDGGPYTIKYPRGDGLTVELGVPGCKRGAVSANGVRHTVDRGWAVAHFPDGTYQLTATCDDGTLVPDTMLVVRRDPAQAEN
jgi:hypothetical protein